MESDKKFFWLREVFTAVESYREERQAVEDKHRKRLREILDQIIDAPEAKPEADPKPKPKPEAAAGDGAKQ